MEDRRRSLMSGAGLARIGAVVAVPAAGVAVYVLAVAFGEVTGARLFWLGTVGAAALLHPAAMFGLDAPRWWFSTSRPRPSAAYVRLNRIVGAVVLLGSVLAALLLPG